MGIAAVSKYPPCLADGAVGARITPRVGIEGDDDEGQHEEHREA